MSELIKISDVIKICKSLYASYGTTAFFAPIPVFENLLRTSAVDVDKYVPQWIAVKDRLPEPNTRVLVYSKQGSYMNLKVDYITRDGSWFNSLLVTHWMPLPELPKGENDDLYPSYADARYIPTDSDKSPGLAGGISYKELMEGDNKDKFMDEELYNE